MIWIDLSNRRDDAVVEGEQSRPFGIGGLIHGIIPCNPGISFVSAGDVLPQIDGAVLEVDMVPEGSVASRVVAVPVLVLTSGKGV